jgi:hypothetical protein
MLYDDIIRGITPSAANYTRGLFCPAELWEQVLEHLAVVEAETLLDNLPPEAQIVLRDAYRERPLSLQSGSGYGEIRRVVEEWCRRGGRLTR